MDEDDVFPGFTSDILKDGYTQIPNSWFEALQRIDNLAELKEVLYVIRHTWGFRNDDGEREEERRITVDEFAYGRKLKNGTRFDGGTHLGPTAVKEGLKRATTHEYLICEVDDSDLARIKKTYGLKMLPEEEEEDEDESGSHNETAEGHNPTTQSRNPTLSGTESDRRSEKETPERNSVEETERERALTLSSFFDEALKFIREKKQVNLYQLERYMHRFIRVRGKQDITLKIKGLAIWTGSSDDFAHVIYALQEYRSHIRIEFCPESVYSDKGRKPRLPVATRVKDYEELHWQPIIILYKD